MKRTCTKCGKNRSVTDSRGRAVFSPRGKICIHCRNQTSRATAKNQRLQATYNITLEEYNALFAAQEGRCAICLGKRREALSVDHCHKTNQVRGLLCRRCNGRLLTAALDKPDVLRRAADYLESPPSEKTIGVRYTPGGTKPRQRYTNRRAKR